MYKDPTTCPTWIAAYLIQKYPALFPMISNHIVRFTIFSVDPFVYDVVRLVKFLHPPMTMASGAIYREHMSDSKGLELLSV
mmetsp:Transcript_1020/g.1513  ORF Transcript_1020/g.1513 Transcript_1020/m.1513 type:complete len:81 (+) Transcript_1020:464-706(+)